MGKDGLVFVGQVVKLDLIPGADFIQSATVLCGEGGKWQGVVRRFEIQLNDLCVVFLPDSLIPKSEEMAFMKAHHWRVKMRRFKGAPSEVVIIPYPYKQILQHPIGTDMTLEYKVTRYHKPIPPHLQGIAIGNFPEFIPKTDELNYQRYPELVDNLVGKSWYMTEKADGSSTTAFKWKGHFGLCSRNLELERNEDNGYWKIVMKYNLEELLPEGIALQWETCGPGIQSNPMGLKEIEGYLFSAYNISEKRYCNFKELKDLSALLKFPLVRLIEWGNCFIPNGVELRGEGVYSNGKQREGVVIRSQENYGHAPISFKVINLNFEK